MRKATNKNEDVTKATQQEDITKLMERDHKPLKRLIKVMKDEDSDASEVKAAFDEFAPLLEAHAHPEEESLYTRLKEQKELVLQGFEGETEHGIAEDLINQIKQITDKNDLRAHIKVLAELVEHHIEEEEDEMIPLIRKNMELEERIQIGREYLELRQDYEVAEKVA